MSDLSACRGHVVRCGCRTDGRAHIEVRVAVRVMPGQSRTMAEPPLSAREWQVARLVAEGWTNRRIADALVVSPRTVDTHVSHALARLRLGSRAQLAAWVVSQPCEVAIVAEALTASAA